MNSRKQIIILSSDDIRHNYFKLMFSNAPQIKVLKTYAESEFRFSLGKKQVSNQILEDIIQLHFNSRHNTEYDFFSDIILSSIDNSNTKYISKNDINTEAVVNEIISLNPDYIVTYGCSILRSRLLEVLKNRIINVHLGISPYYFGSGTNFHAMVENNFQCVGYTFMYMDEGIDTGKIIHQSRAEIFPFDNPHQIGNRLIKQMTNDFIKLIQNMELIVEKTALTTSVGRTYKRKDATYDRIKLLYDNFKNNAVFNYLKIKEGLEREYPIVEQELLKR